jgi:hypothetical protein
VGPFWLHSDWEVPLAFSGQSLEKLKLLRGVISLRIVVSRMQLCPN